uniref:Peptidase S55 domain-containing protein n=1 Tax=mine drainage metagenome TaxID=410659 RepID=E6QI28_9ZZZZ
MLLAVVCGLVASTPLLAASDSGGTAPDKKLPAVPPSSTAGIFPLSQVHRGLHGTAWTVFEGTQPEAMDVEILGVLRGARGPGRDLILARLGGTKPEYTGVVAGMSGSPVYIDGKLLGALSYRIGEFSKEPIAGITPIAQMLEVRDLTAQQDTPNTATADANSNSANPDPMTTQAPMQAMETPLLMSGFSPQAIGLWKQRMASTGLDVVDAGGPLGHSEPNSASDSSTDAGPILPGSAVSLQLVRGDMEIAATCTVTYVDLKHLLACGHPVLQAGPVSLPMTRAEVVATLPSPLNAFKIINTGATIGAFTEDRDAAIAGLLGAHAHMIPLTVAVTTGSRTVEHRVEVLNLPSMTTSAILVSVYQMLLQTNQSTAETSYHITGSIRLAGMAPIPIDSWGTPGATMVSQLAAAIGVGNTFDQLYANASRQATTQAIQSIQLHVQAIPSDVRTELESVRVISSGIVHAGDTVAILATIRPWQQPARILQLRLRIPETLPSGTLRVLVGSANSLDRTIDAAQPPSRSPSLQTIATLLRQRHPSDLLYLSLLVPEAQASVNGDTLDSLPLSMANAFEPERAATAASLHGESIRVVDSVPTNGPLTGQQVLTLHVEPGGGLH